MISDIGEIEVEAADEGGVGGEEGVRRLFCDRKRWSVKITLLFCFMLHKTAELGSKVQVLGKYGRTVLDGIWRKLNWHGLTCQLHSHTS